MAQTGFTPILLYASNTATSIPSAGNLTNSANGAEVAVNTADKRLFTKDSGGAVVELGTNPSALSVAGNVTLSGGTANGVLYLNGSKVATSGSALTFDGTNLVNGGNFSTGTSGLATYFRSSGTAYTQIGDNQTLGAGTAFVIGSSTPYLAGNVAGSEQMRLTSTGLGIGTSSPTAPLQVNVGTATSVARFYHTGSVAGSGNGAIAFGDQATPANGTGLYFRTNGEASLSTATSGYFTFYTNAAERMRLDSSGNLGLGVTPSAFASAQKAFQVLNGSLYADASSAGLQYNSFYNGTNERYIANGYATSYYQASGQHIWRTAASGTAGNAISFTQAMTLDASGNLLVGGTSNDPFGRSFTGTRVVFGNNSGETGLTFRSGTGTASYFEFGTDTTLLFSLSGNASAGTTIKTVTSVPLIFGTNNGERARITSGGDLLMGTTGAGSGNTSGRMRLVGNTGGVNNYYAEQSVAGGYCFASNTVSNGGVYYHAIFLEAGTARGSITSNGSATAYNTSSDYRLKDNPQPLTNSGAFIDALQPKTWNWKTDGSKGVGFIAHEVQAVSPTSVVGTKDAVDADGKPVMQAMEYGSAEFIANIIAELQSLRARVAALEAQP